MNKELNIFIFFRDYRINDNIGFLETLKNKNNIIPIFIFTHEQINKEKNKYFSNNSLQFLCESIENLDLNFRKENKKLYIFKGEDTIEIINNLSIYFKISSISYNKDYTPYAINRSNKINKFCKKKNIELNEYEDYLLAPIETFVKDDKDPYTVYTPFKNKVYKMENLINKPNKKYNLKNVSKIDELLNLNYTIHIKDLNLLYVFNKNNLVNGGREQALKHMNIKKYFNYSENRNKLSYNTTHLSAYIKYGCISIREVYWLFKNNNSIKDQLIWREFYYYIVYYFPDILQKKINFNRKYDKLKWTKNNIFLESWKKGETGYPIVDACMKELNTTGYMHNRGRLISSNFLNRMLGHDWRDGELYFAQKLIDYDPIVNNGNWQWIASTGVDPKPYFQRLFNPWLQSKKYDPECIYIKKWLPQLKNVENKDIHEWDKNYHKYDMNNISYKIPIVNYENARKKSIEQYKLKKN
tara:strand:- start:14 stop:1420 length:1407 start_codon:yes stop_codon:yes gene_type:complete